MALPMFAANGSIRPVARPEVPELAPVTSPRPKLKDEQLALFGLGKKRKREREARKGMVCGDPALQGDAIGRVPGKIKGCGVEDAVRLKSVSGVALSQHSVMDCVTAKALKTWVDGGLKPAFGNLGGGVSKIRVAAHYACRTRNNQKGAKISEHGKGHAIDISGIYLENGNEVNVLKDWGKGRGGKALAGARKAACGPFGTVLGPGSDRFHRDHFHFDTARYRGGPYCK
nr:extensin family protein [Lentibacter algarum]